MCGTFKSVYFDYKSRANNEVPSNPWRIQNTALFPRLDSFLERCHDLLDLCKTVVQVRFSFSIINFCSSCNYVCNTKEPRVTAARPPRLPN